MGRKNKTIVRSSDEFLKGLIDNLDMDDEEYVNISKSDIKRSLLERTLMYYFHYSNRRLNKMSVARLKRLYNRLMYRQVSATSVMCELIQEWADKK